MRTPFSHTLGLLEAKLSHYSVWCDLYGKARDFNREIRYYHDAAQAYSGDSAISLAAANNLGYAYEQMGRYNLGDTAL
ncbi:MAG: hypothetical protein WDM89_10880 [Rhizomicrobium sp.]